LTEYWHAFSVTFPAGETFFIDSVLHYGPQLREEFPELWQVSENDPLGWGATVTPIVRC
jgi:hypothetical protein